MVLTLTLPGCNTDSPAAASDPAPAIAVTNTYLASAAREVAGPDLAIISLAPPGTCPGHFDIRPSQVDRLRRCRLLLRFDFQGSLDEKLQGHTEGGLSIHEIKPPGSLCEPQSYLAACRQVAEALTAANLPTVQDFAPRLHRIEQRIDAAAARMHARIRDAGLAGRAVLCSEHQAGFCRWLGLKVVGTFRGGDTALLGELDEAISAARSTGVTLVIGNQPEGRLAADALAERFAATVVILDNFPAQPKDEGTYDDMLRDNVDRLVAAATSR